MTNKAQRVLSGTKDPSIEAAADVMATFERIWGGTRVIPRNHPSRFEMIDKFIAVAHAHVQRYGPLQLDVAPFALMRDGMPVFELDRTQDNYVYGLYRDGVRRLTLDENLTTDEIDRFIELLRTNFNDPALAEDDLVTLLWDAELHGIHYWAVDGIGESDEDEELPGDFPEMEVMVVDAQKVLIPRTEPGRPLALPGVEQGPEADYERSAPELPESQLAGMQDYELDAIRRSTEYEDPALGAKLADIILQTRERGDDRALELVGQFAEDCLAKDQNARLCQALTTFQSLLEDEPERLESLVGAAATPPVLQSLLLRYATGELDEEGVRLLGFVASSAFPAFWRQTLELEERHRAAAISVLQPLAERHSSFLGQQLREGEEQVALTALDLLRRLEPALVGAFIMSGLEHPSRRVRIAAAMALRQDDSPPVRDALLSLLRDKDEEVRTHALTLATRFGAAAEQALIGVLTAIDFSRRSPREQSRAIAALGRVAEERGLRIVRRLASGETNVLQETQIAAIEVLGQRRDAAALDALKALAKKLVIAREVKAAARKAVDAIEGSRS